MTRPSVEVVVSIIFGVIMLIIGVLGLLQTYAGHSGIHHPKKYPLPRS